jgi:hypothetical protein
MGGLVKALSFSTLSTKPSKPPENILLNGVSNSALSKLLHSMQQGIIYWLYLYFEPLGKFTVSL